jgi:hypothetical protein
MPGFPIKTIGTQKTRKPGAKFAPAKPERIGRQAPVKRCLARKSLFAGSKV